MLEFCSCEGGRLVRWRYATALLVMMVVAGLLVPEVGASPMSLTGGADRI